MTSPSRRPSGSTRRTRSATSRTAASCTACCAIWARGLRPRPRDALARRPRCHLPHPESHGKRRRGGAAGGRGSTRPAPRLRVGSQGGISDAIVPGGGTDPGTSLMKVVRPPASGDYLPIGAAVSTTFVENAAGPLDSPAATLDQLDSDHRSERPDRGEGRREQRPGRLVAEQRDEDQGTEPEISDPVQKPEQGGLRVVSGREPEDEQCREQERLEPGDQLHPAEEGAGDRLRQGLCRCEGAPQAEPRSSPFHLGGHALKLALAWPGPTVELGLVDLPTAGPWFPCAAAGNMPPWSDSTESRTPAWA